MKTAWIPSFSLPGNEHIVDGARLARDTQSVLIDFDLGGYDILSITPVVSGRYNWAKFDARTTGGDTPAPTVAPDTCASWGYSMTDGMMVVGKRKKQA